MNKKINLLFIFCLAILTFAKAQTPKAFNYSAVARNASGIPIATTTIGIQISILKSSSLGSTVYSENHFINTDDFGLFNLIVGGGSVQIGAMTAIDWSNDDYYLKVGMDANGGTNFLTMGTTQLLSVPYALHAATADSIVGGNSGFSGSYNDLIDKPITISSISSTGDTLYLSNGQFFIANNGGGTGGTVGTYPTGSVFCASGATSIVDVTNPSTGEIWMDRNLGATQAATSSSDANAYGDLYQWGRGADGHQCRNSVTTNTLSSTDQPGHGDFISGYVSNDWRSPQNDNLWQGVNGINNPCPDGYRLPTVAELELEKSSWSSSDAAGAIASPLKLPLGGRRENGNGSFIGVGTGAYYWSSAMDGYNFFGIDSSHAGMGSYPRSMGFSVRCIKD